MTTLVQRLPRPMFWAVPLGVALTAAAVHGVMMLMPAPADLDLSHTRTSEAGAFVASIEPGPITMGEPQTWTVEVTMTDGSAVGVNDITVDGGMPRHGHGLPTEPRVARDLGDGRFEVENLLFTMAGWWVVNIHVETPAGEDQATFNLTL